MRQQKRERIQLKRAYQIKPHYGYQSPHPPVTDQGHYGPPNIGPTPPTMQGGNVYAPPLSPPPPMMGPPPPPWQPDGWGHNYYRSYGWNGYGSKSSKAHHIRSIGPRFPPNIPPIHPGVPPYIPPDGPYPPSSPTTSDKPTYYPTYESTSHEYPTSEYTGETVQITIPGLMNSYGIKFPKSREEYDAMVRVLQQTIYDTARASLYVNQMVTAVKVIEIEGITPQRSTRRELQSDEETGSFECTFQQRRSCCARDPPLGAGNPAQYCESLGCNLNNCRRIRFDIVAEQLLEQGMNRNLQSIFEVSTQRAVNDLYNTITLYMTEQVENEEFTISLRKNAYYCGDVCLNTMADATVMNVEF